MKTKDLPEILSIKEIREKYQSNKITPETVIHEIINRSVDDEDYNIWITPPTIEWIQPYLERLKTLNPEENLLWGIPFSIKDNIDLAGIFTTAGCADFAYMPDDHAVVVKRLIDAGAIPVGKTNLDQFATGLVGTRSPYGETKNAYIPDLISGGSSSGSAIAVARGMAAFSLGTDTAGSGRVPAALNRLIGYKPSLGAWPVKGVVPACASLDCVSVFTNSLDDALLVDQVVRGLEESDPWSQDIIREPNSLPDKICLLKEIPVFFGPFTAEYHRAWKRSVNRIKKLNIPIEYIEGSYLSEAASILYDGPWVAERWADLSSFVNEHENCTFPVTEAVLRLGEKPEYDAASLFRAFHRLQVFKQKAQQQLKNAVLIMPTTGGTWTRDQTRENPFETNNQMGLYTNHCNLLDLSAINIPAGDAGDNLPFGITLFSGKHNEHLLAGLADLFLNGKRPLMDNKDKTLLAVCGLHMRGYTFEEQMIDHGAIFVKETKTAPKYKMIKLDSNPPKPGLIKVNEKGVSIEIELWEMPLAELGKFTAFVPSPLAIGKIELKDGTEVNGFICESVAEETSEDISDRRGWRYLSF